MAKTDYKTIDEYIKTFPKDEKLILEKIRKTIRELAPSASETISYQLPAFKLNGKYLICFAGWKKHLSLYPIPKGSESFRKEISQYIKGKGTIQFPLYKPIPLDLVIKIVKFRVKENEVKRNKLYAKN